MSVLSSKVGFAEQFARMCPVLRYKMHTPQLPHFDVNLIICASLWFKKIGYM